MTEFTKRICELTMIDEPGNLNTSLRPAMFMLKKERKVVSLIDTHLHDVEQWLEAASGTVESCLRGDVSEAESPGLKAKGIGATLDRIRDEIWDKLCDGAYLPIIREDLFIVVKSVEKIIGAARSCCDTFMLQQPDIPETLRDPFVRLADLAFHLIHPIKDSVESYLKGPDTVNVVRDKAKKFWKTEADINNVEHDLELQIFSSALNPLQKIQLKSCLKDIVAVSAKAVEAMEQIQRITVKIAH